MYRWVERERQLELTIEDENLEGVFVEALVALGDLLTEERHGEPLEHRVEVQAGTGSQLLVRWLEALLELGRSDGFVPERAVEISIHEESVEALVFGQRLQPQTRVKAVREGRAELARIEHAWRALVVLEL